MSKLVRDVAARLKIPDEEAELVLRALSKLIRKQASNDGVVRVPEIGVFRMEDGELTFTPDDQLAGIANYRYTGLKPLPALAALEGGHDTSATGLPEDLDIPLDKLPETDEDDEHAAVDESEPAEASSDAAPQQEAGDEVEVPVGQPELAASVSDVLDTENEDSKEEPSDETEETTVAPAAEEAPEPTAGANRPASRRRPTPPRRRNPKSSWILVALLLAGLVVAGGLWLMTGEREADDGTVAEAPQQTEEPAPLDPPETSSDIAESDASPEAADEEASAEPQEDLDVAAGGYTLIVASRASRGNIEQMVEAYRDVLVPQGYPVGVLGPREGETRYRLGVGQFESTDAALEALEALSGQIPGDAWVYGIRPDMDPDQ